jgi:serine/threonine protein kinase
LEAEDTVTLGHRIGQGGSGQVYKANGTPFAIKVIDRPARARHERQLINEITCLQKMVDDSAVPSLHNVAEDSDFVYLVMVLYIYLYNDLLRSLFAADLAE